MHPLTPLVERLRDGSATVAGVLSGTSADGIDVALMRFDPAAAGAGDPLGPPETLCFRTQPYPAELGTRLRAWLDGRTGSLEELAFLSRDLGLAFGRAAREAADTAGLGLDLVASHGQTVWHHDGRPAGERASLQLGEPDFVAEAARATVVADFRGADLAAGGEGAPVSALADDLVFARAPRPLAVLNLGGIANWTWLGPRGHAGGAGDAPLAFDTGPAGSLLDGLARRLLGRAFDAGGQVALAGRADPCLLKELESHPFVARRPPKSTGRDTFGEAWIDALLAAAELRRGCTAETPELLAAASDFVARTAAAALEAWWPAAWGPWQQATRLVTGGGAWHARLISGLEAATGGRLADPRRFGVDPDAREALVFGVLGARCVLGIPSTAPAVTGAEAGRIPGRIRLFAPRT